MALGLHDLLTKQHKFSAQDETLRKTLNGKTATDLTELEKEVRSILISAGQPIRTSQIEKDYRGFFGRKFPVWELGLSNVVDVLKKLSGACHIVDDSQPDPLVSVKTTEKNVHLLKLVKKNKNAPKSISEHQLPAKSVFVPFNVQDGIRRLLYEKMRIKKIVFLKMLEERFDLKYMKLNVEVELLVRSLPHILVDDGAFVKSAYDIQESEIHIPEHLHFDGEHVIPSYRLGKAEIIVAGNLRNLLREKKLLQVIDIPRCYTETFGKELNWYSFGFKDLWKFIQLLPGKFKLVLHEGMYVAVSENVDISELYDIRQISKDKFCGEKVYVQVLNKIRQLVLQVNLGLNVKHFESAYETLFYEKLVIRGDFHKFLLELQDLNIFKVKEVGGSTVLLPYDSQRANEDLIKDLLIPKKQPNVEALLEVMKPSDTLETLKFPGVVNVNNQVFCAGYVTCIDTPNSFYIRIIGMDVNHGCFLEKEFIDLSDKMFKCYLTDIEKYTVPFGELRMDMICAACLKGVWRRVIVEDVGSSGKIIVRALDTGERHEVEASSIRYLLNEFSKLPILACKATLFNVGPGTVKWTVNAVVKFKTLTSDASMMPVPLSVVVVHRNRDGLLQVVLTRTFQEKDVHIGDELVDAGLAVFKDKHSRMTALFS